MTAIDPPRVNRRMLDAQEVSYTVRLLSGDDGLWTVYETVTRPIAKVASQQAANALMAKLEASGKS